MGLAAMLFSKITYPFRAARYGGATNLNDFAPDLKEYCHSMKLKAAPSEETTAAFDMYLANRLNSVDKFSDLKVAGTPLTEKFKDHPDILADLNATLGTLTDNTKDAQRSYNKKLKDINTTFENDEPYSPQRFTDSFASRRGTASAAITAQQKKDLERLEEKFQDPAFKAKLTAAGMSEGDITKLKDEMKAKLVESHKKEKEAFDKTTTDTLNKWTTDQQFETARLSWLLNQYKNNQAMREQIDAIVAKKIREQGENELSVQITDKAAIFKDIKPSDIANITTVTGKPLTKTAKGYELEMPNLWLSHAYYQGSLNRMRADMRSLVGAIRAQGYSGIKLSFDHKDPDHAYKIAREAYAACREEGFEPNKIKMVINGEVLKGDELHKKLFGTVPEKEKAAELSAQHFEKMRGDRAKEAAGASDVRIAQKSVAMREELGQGRRQQQARADAARQSERVDVEMTTAPQRA
ncbi:coiled coil domain-containing protein [Legionella adelaidensis]|uniref:Coiled coil domain-containing protein n=2 Tax=Legionella adelaidensis TaxID=45056 RepID=A0A0W0R3G5_9GAMM|nr:coiled coil domain-containing protein [Legionella adelaidensis]